MEAIRFVFSSSGLRLGLGQVRAAAVYEVPCAFAARTPSDTPSAGHLPPAGGGRVGVKVRVAAVCMTTVAITSSSSAPKPKEGYCSLRQIYD